MLIRFTLLFAAVLAVATGWYQLARFSSTPGEQTAAPARLPSNIPQISAISEISEIKTTPALAAANSSSQTPLLLVFMHPRCSCTPATLQQLDHILDVSHAPVRLALVVYQSAVVNEPSAQSARLLRHTAQIVPDINGRLARRFGAATSGEVVLYSSGGQLLYQGGITPLRAHTGDSLASDALRLALTTGEAQARTFNVFGCPIFSAPSHSGHAG
jgi:hypothetical protein